ncbi:hypothetical protein DSL92_04915 [Billgrantia gudaonensis]|uniref:Uncharacterized protein n=1 Tax=Billgrantia gudaonensis TaxID=376427 RepID=A0A3S0NE51_9GAMM|nr:hypothetical protein DSL92_04915 [Halomonas gudaonensis]
MTLDIPGADALVRKFFTPGLHQSIQLSNSHQTINNMTWLRVQLGEASAKIGQISNACCNPFADWIIYVSSLSEFHYQADRDRPFY